MYNNPYNYYPYMNIPMNNMNFIKPRGGIFKSISNVKWSDVLNTTQKTLNVINQAIPVYYQIKPIFNNVKSLGRLVSLFNEDDSSKNKETKKENSSNNPTFFIN